VNDSTSVDDKTRAVQRGVRRALLEHAKFGFSVPIIRDGRMIKLSPEEILEELRQTEKELGRTDER
jgi:hypothetical protein